MAATATIEIAYRDVSTYYPRLVRRVEAVFGDFRGYGSTKTEAKAELVEQIGEQAEHLFERRYRMGVGYNGEPVVFAFYYCRGWCYDIVGGDGRHYSSTCTSEPDRREAWDAMLRHFDQYTAAAKEVA